MPLLPDQNSPVRQWDSKIADGKPGECRCSLFRLFYQVEIRSSQLRPSVGSFTIRSGGDKDTAQLRQSHGIDATWERDGARPRPERLRGYLSQDYGRE
jgi:hypothetical protein